MATRFGRFLFHCYSKGHKRASCSANSVRQYGHRVKFALALLEQAYDSRSRAHMALRDPAAAMSDVDELLRMRPDQAEYLCRRAAVLIILRKHKEALNQLRDLLRTHPRFVAGRILLARQLAVAGKTDEAFVQINAAIALDGKDPFAYYMRALLYYTSFDADRCLEDISRSIALKPLPGFCAVEQPYTIRGMCLLGLGRPREAIPNVLLAKRLYPSSPGATWGVWRAYADMGRWQAARRVAEQYVKLDSKSIQAKLAYAESCYKTGAWKEAEKCHGDLVASDPKDVRVQAAAGELYCNAGRYRLGLSYYDNAIELDANNVAALYGKGFFLASSPEKDIRNGPLAVKLAERIRKMERISKAEKLNAAVLLAVAKAECGEYDQAELLTRQAIKEAGPQSCFRGGFEEKLKLFQQKKPYRIIRKAVKEKEKRK